MSHTLLFIQPNSHILDLIKSIPDSYTILTASSLKEAQTLMTRDCAMLFVAYADIKDTMDSIHELPNSQTLIVFHAAHDELEQALRDLNFRALYRVITDSASEAEFQSIIQSGSCIYNRRVEVEELRQEVLELNRQDKLTGCCNRNYGTEQLHHNLKRAIRHGQYLSVVLADIDSLKGINECYGHDAGDTVLISFVQHIQAQLRSDIDVICRWGEDEFLIILPETNIQGAGKVADRLRVSLGEHNIDIGKKMIHAHASFGVSGFAPEDKYRNCTNDSLMLIVRRCLMQAKAAGGDTVLCCP